MREILLVCAVVVAAVAVGHGIRSYCLANVWVQANGAPLDAELAEAFINEPPQTTLRLISVPSRGHNGVK